MSSIRFMHSMSRIVRLPRIKKNPFLDGEFVCPKARKTQQVRISTIMSCLESDNCETVVKFVDRNPTYLPFVVSAMIGHNEKVAFNAEWCVRRLGCTANDITRALLSHSLAGFLDSPWINEGKKANDLRANELSREMRELYDFISNRHI